MIANVLEFGHQLFSKLIVDDGHIERRSLVGQEVAIIGGLEMKLQIVQCFTLHQIEVVGLFDDAALEATNQAFQVAIVDVEDTLEEHGFGPR